MTRTHDFDRLARAWLDLMPSEVPDRVVESVLQAVETTPQVRPPIGAAFRRSNLMNRVSLAATAAVIVVVAGGALLFNQLQTRGPDSGSPVPSSSPAASVEASPTGALPAALQARWFGSAKAVPGMAAGAGSTVVFSASGLAITQSNAQNAAHLTATATLQGGQLHVQTGPGIAGGCTAGQVGAYRYSLSPSGETLTITTSSDDCAVRGAALAGTWWKIDCHAGADASCLGMMDAGAYGSQYFASVGASGVPWLPRFGALSFRVPDGWANTADWPNAFSLAPASDAAAAAAGSPGTDPAAEIAIISNAMAESQATPCSQTVDASVRPGAAAYLAWLRTVPSLQVGAATPLTIDGHSATSVDLSVPAAPTGLCDGTDPFVEYLMSTGWLAATGTIGPQYHAIGVGNRDRLILLDVPSGLVAIVISTNDASRFDAFVQQAMPIVQSFQFSDAFPTP
jgi:hypothetical protein